MNSLNMEKLCPGSLPLDLGRFPGFRFLINTRGYAAVREAPDAEVHGIIWQVTREHEKKLDQYEGLELCRKEYLEVIRSEGGLKLSVLVYLSSDIQPGVPEKKYMESILLGARSACKTGLPKEYLMELESWSPIVDG